MTTMVTPIRRVGHQFGNGLINSDELRQKLSDISNNPSDNKQNLGKAFQAGLAVDSHCSNERAETAREIVQEIDPDIYQGAEDTYDGAFGSKLEEN